MPAAGLGFNEVMVSVNGQLQLQFVPFERLIDPSSDFHRLGRFLETSVNEQELTAR